MPRRACFVSPPIPLTLGPNGLRFSRADIEFYGVDQSGPSYEARVFLNNPDADLDTPLTPESGYAGSFHVYGYGVWPADIGEKRGTRPDDAPTIRAPITKTVIATEAVRAAAKRGPEVTVSVVPVYPGHPPKDACDALKLERVAIVIR
jgi:hypothetical protein